MTRQRRIKQSEKSNWGDFGEDHQIGRLNLLTPDRRLRAIREVSCGIAFTLSLPLDYPGSNKLFKYCKAPHFFQERRRPGHNYNFSLSNISASFSDVASDDAVLLYTQCSTQWDALGHFGQTFDADGDGVAEKAYYNSYHAGVDIVGSGDSGETRGARALGIENLSALIFNGVVEEASDGHIFRTTIFE